MKGTLRDGCAWWVMCIALVVGIGDSSSALSQTRYNPDISVIGDTRGFWHNDNRRPGERNMVNLDLNEVEVAIQGYLNPYARADVFITWTPDETAALEESYMTVARGLPWGMTLRAGRFLLDFGKINPLHSHAYSFVERPLVEREFFGAEGLTDIAVDLSVAIPTGDVATTVAGSVLKGDFLEGTGGLITTRERAGKTTTSPADSVSRTVPNQRGFMARWESFFALGDVTSLSVGASLLTGEPAVARRRTFAGADIKFKWRPDRYRSLTAGTEWLMDRSPKGTGPITGHVTSHGMFSYFDYQFRQRYNAGLIGSWMQAVDRRRDHRWEVGAFAGFSPVEETSVLRLLVSYHRDNSMAKGYWTTILQLLFSLGPHQPHAF